MEHEPQSNEELNRTAAELTELSAEKQAAEHNETASNEKQQERVENAREAVKKTEAPPFEEHKPEPKPATGIDRNTSYQHTMASLQRHLSPASRAFSKIIHNPAVDKTSEIIGATVMRPSVTLGGTVTAVIVGGFVYLTARNYGYSLHGSEILLALAVGGLLGAMIEGLIKLFRR